MALIKCVDCGGDVATSAEHCLHCGSKEFDIKKVQEKNTKVAQERSDDKANKAGCIAAIVGAAVGSAAAQLILEPKSSIGDRVVTGGFGGFLGAAVLGIVVFIAGQVFVWIKYSNDSKK